VDDTPSVGAASSELLRVWTVGSGNIVEQRWRGATTRQEQADPAGRLLAIDERDAQRTTFFAVRQVADARGYPTARSVAIGAEAEVTVAETDPHGRIVAAAFDQAGPIDVGTIVAAGAAARQTDLDAVVAAVSAALPPYGETLDIQLDPDGARRQWERLQNGAVVEDRQYDVDALGRSVEVGSGRTGDSEGLPMADRGTTCRYDAFRRLSRVERNGALVAALGYDAAGRVATVTTPQGTTRLLYAGGGLVEARSGNQVVAQYVRLPGGPLIETGLPASPRRALIDGQGSLVGLADSTGAVTASALCDPFGEVRAINGTWPAIGPRFQGLLGVNGLDVLLTDVRTYDPRIGAFREIDPAGFPDGLNRGLFADGNPLAFCDPSGLMAQPADMAGRPSATPGIGGMYGESMLAFRPSDRPYNWAERAALAMGGAMWSLVEGLYQLGAMLEDLKYLTLDIGLRAIGIDIDYKARSGLGQMAQAGQVSGGLDVFRVMGKGLIGTPGRLIDAMERDDPFEVGREAMSGYMVGKPVLVGLAKTAFNGGVSALRIGGFKGGLRLNRRIRTWQVRRMQADGEKLGGAQGQPPIAVRYVGRMKSEKGYVTLGAYNPARSVILMTDAAFNPVYQMNTVLAGLNPWTFGGSFTSRLGLMWGAVSRGNFALRTLTHEFFHHYQRSTSPSFFKQSGFALDYRLDPAEFTQPGIKAPWPGAWNAELGVPRGPLPVGAFMGLQVGLNSFARPRNETQ
jgi:RHS repeat-associated protein